MKGIVLKSLVTNFNTGLRIGLNGFPAIYIDYIRREKTNGRLAIPDWAGEQVGVYRYGWDGVAFTPSGDDSMKTKILGVLNLQGQNPDTLVFGGGGIPKLVVKRLATSGGSTCVLVCRWGLRPSECKFAGKTC